MAVKSFKSLLVAVFSVFFVVLSAPVQAQHEPGGHEPAAQEAEHAPKKEGFDAKEVIFGHIMDGHDFHFFDWKGHAVGFPLPVIIYSQQKGLSVFMSSKFEHGHAEYKGYKLVKQEIGEKIVSTDPTEQVYDLSLTRNVVQMLLALIILVWILISIAKAYGKGLGVTSAPKGKQNFFEPIITFVRDEVSVPNLGAKSPKYLPFLLTVFFFILINNIFGLVPGSANVTGNIAFTVVLGIIAFIVILFSSNRHYWGHIFNPPGVPLGVKFILVPVELLSAVLIKPGALIIRLFANMVAGHIIIICLISLIFVFTEKLGQGFGIGSTVISIPFTIFIYFIEILVAFLQAFIFTMLTAVFISQAMEGDHGHGEEAAHH